MSEPETQNKNAADIVSAAVISYAAASVGSG